MELLTSPDSIQKLQFGFTTNRTCGNTRPSVRTPHIRDGGYALRNPAAAITGIDFDGMW